MRQTLLDQRVQEVIRTLPQQQAEEIERYDELLREGTTSLEYGTFFAPVSRPPLPKMIGSATVPGIATELAWGDLEQAETTGFPGLAPERAMYMGRLSTQMAKRLSMGTIKGAEEFLKATTGLIGLHMSILGDMDVIQSEAAKDRLAYTEQKYQSDFVQPIARKHAVYISSRR